MFAKLSGLIDEISPPHIVIDVNGVGYFVSASARTLGALGRVGERATLYIETIVREDAIALYGFADRVEQAWFRLLTTVQGVGARVALSILSSLPPDQLARAIAMGDKSMLSQADGVGPKLAARLVTELKDKPLIATVSKLPASHGGLPATGAGSHDHATGAISALVNLGYRRAEATEAIAGILDRMGREVPLNDLIRLGLRELAA